MDTLQQKYWDWHNAGMALRFELTQAVTEVAQKIFENYRASTDPELVAATKIDIVGDDTFETVWFDGNGRVCCSAMIDDGAPMGWYVEFLDMCLTRQLHELLLSIAKELQT